MNKPAESLVEIQDESLRGAVHDMRQHFHVIDLGLQVLEREGTSAEFLRTIELLKQENQQAQRTLADLLAAASAASIRPSSPGRSD